MNQTGDSRRWTRHSATVYCRTCGVLGILLLTLPAIAQTPAFTPQGVVNAASFRSSSLPSVARGSIITIFGENLANQVDAAAALPLPRILGGAEVLFDGAPAPLFYASPSQINLQVPVELSSTAITTRVTIRRGALRSAEATVFLRGQDPGVFTLLQTGSGPGVIFHADGRLVSLESPVQSGEVLVMYATGMGAVNDPVASGQATPGGALRTVVTPPTVRMNNQNATVEFAGLTPGFVGLYQVNVRVPTGVSGTPLISLTQGPVALSFSAGGPGLQSATPLSAAAGSPDVPVTVTGVNIPSGSELHFGGRRLTTTTQENPRRLVAAIPAAALRVTGPIPLTASTPPPAVESNPLQFQVTGTTIPGTAPTISNVTVSAPSTGSLPASNIAFDFQDPDGDLVYNGTAATNAAVEFRHRACGGLTTSTQSGTFFNRPDQTSGRVSFQLQFIGTISRVTGPFPIEITVLDQARNRSNTITVQVASWVC